MSNQTKTTGISLRLPNIEMVSRDMEIVQGMAVSGLTLDEAKELLELLPAMIQKVEEKKAEEEAARAAAMTDRQLSDVLRQAAESHFAQYGDIVHYRALMDQAQQADERADTKEIEAAFPTTREVITLVEAPAGPTRPEELTEGSWALLVDLVDDAGNWSGMPLFGGNVGGSAESKGHLTHLKKTGYVRTTVDEDDRTLCWVSFEDKTRALFPDTHLL